MNTNSVQLDSTANLLGFSANLNPAQSIAGDQRFDQVFREVSQQPLASTREPRRASSMENADSAQGQENSPVSEAGNNTPGQAVSEKQPEAENIDGEVAAAADSTGPERRDLPETQPANNVETNPTDAQAAISNSGQGIILSAGAAEALKAALMLSSSANATNDCLDASASINSLATEPGNTMASCINNEQSGGISGIMPPQGVLPGPSQAQEASTGPANSGMRQSPETFSSATLAEAASSLEKAGTTGLNAMGIDNRIQQADTAASSQTLSAVNQNQAAQPLETPSAQPNADLAPVVDNSQAQAVDQAQIADSSQADAAANGRETPLPFTTAQSQVAGKEVAKAKTKVEAGKNSSASRLNFLDHAVNQSAAESHFTKNSEGENSNGSSFSLNVLTQQDKTEKALDNAAGKAEFQAFMLQENTGGQASDASPTATANPLEMVSVTGDIRRGDFHSTRLSEKTAMQGEIKPHEVFERSVLDQIVSKASFINRNGQNEMRIQLDPPSLGTIRVQVSVAGDNVTAKLMADNSIARDILEKNIHQLRDSFSEQGLKVQQMSVHVGNDPRQQAADHFRPFYLEKGFSRMNSSGSGESEEINPSALSGNGAGYSEKGGISVFA